MFGNLKKVSGSCRDAVLASKQEHSSAAEEVVRENDQAN